MYAQIQAFEIIFIPYVKSFSYQYSKVLLVLKTCILTKDRIVAHDYSFNKARIKEKKTNSIRLFSFTKKIVNGMQTNVT